jgi:two-component system response regulator CpxR
MSVISIFSGIFCSADAVVRDVMDSTGYRLITDDQIITKAAETSGVPENKVKRAFSAKTSVFNKFTHEKECSIASLRLALATELEKGPAVVHGFSSLLIPSRSAICSGSASSLKSPIGSNRPRSSRG